MKKDSISRRAFIASGAAALSGVAVFGLSGVPVLGNTLKTDTVRVGLIGAGNRGTGVVSLMKNITGLQLVACCDIIPEHLKSGMAMAVKGAKAYTDYRKLLENKNIDAVIIATPLFLHYQMTVDALEAGKHVYLEKTMTYDIPQALDLVKRMRSSDLVLQIGHQYRYYGLYHKVKEVLSEKWFGKVTHFECQYNRNSNWRYPVSDPKLERTINWRMYKEYSGGVLAELCSHQIDMVNYFLESHPVKVIGMGGISYWKDGRETNDHVRAVYEYPDGIQSSVTSVLSNAYNGYSIRILSDKATIEIQRNKAFLYPEPQKSRLGVVDGVTGATMDVLAKEKVIPIIPDDVQAKGVDPTTSALQGFYECIRDHKKPVSNVETGRDAAVSVHIANKAVDTVTCQEWKADFSA